MRALGVYKRLLVAQEPEEAVWRGLVGLTGLLTVLKLAGVLFISWWWVVLPVALPIVGTACMVILCIGVLCLVPDGWDREDHDGEQ